MDKQSGITKGQFGMTQQSSSNLYEGFKSNGGKTNINDGIYDKGGASRFFYVAKASKSERNFGLESFEENQTIGGGGTYNVEAGAKYGSIKAKAQNFHPTVKPVKLMQYLVRMITPKNGKILDPFNGSGTTGIASVLEGFDYTGIELDSDYCKIAEARITAWNEIEEYEQYKKIIENQEEEKGNSKYGTQANLFD